MTAREQDMLSMYGVNPRSVQNRARDLQQVYNSAAYSSPVLNGIRIEDTVDDSNWYDALSSMMQTLHSTSISSLNDDNRQDEKEIEILEEASKITDKDIQMLSDAKDFFVEEEVNAIRQGNSKKANYYRDQAAQIEKRRSLYLDKIKQADDIVKKDKQLFTLSGGHNPILEAVGEIIDYGTESASAGAVAGGLFGPAGAMFGALIGSAGGLLYGGYDYIKNGRMDIDRSAYETPISKNRNENYANSIKTRQSYKQFRSNQINEEQQDLFDWQTNYKVSDYYRRMEELGQYSNTGIANYLYYNLPGIVGSSFSDTKDMRQQAVSAYGLNKLAKISPKGKWSIRAVAFAEALRNGWQASLNENHAETSDTATKKVLNEISKNKPLADEIVKNAREVAKNIYGLDDKEAKELVNDEVAFTMYNSNIGGLDPRKLDNKYEYYKTARKLGDSGADTQFWRDMVATAGGDVLEAALMITPYGALANRSKVFARSVSGAAVGAVAGEFLGFGVPGSIIGGVSGAAIGQIPIARRMQKSVMSRYQAIADKVLPKLQNRIAFNKAKRVASAFGVTALAEAAEEGTQYLNSLDAEKMLEEELNKSDASFSSIGDILNNTGNLLLNDLNKRGEVAKAVLSQFGLTDSPYQSDTEFWSNWKGGLFLGGLMTGANTLIREAVGYKKAKQTAKFVQDEILSSAVAGRTESQDAILKGAAFAKNGIGGHLEDILDVLEFAKKENSRRNESPFTEKDFNDLQRQASRIIRMGESKSMQNKLKGLGYKLGSEQANYALAINEYYSRKLNTINAEDENNSAKIQSILNSAELIQALDDIAGPEILSDEGADENGFKVREKIADGSIVEYIISEREKLKRLHQNASTLIAVTQLLKDLQDIVTLKQWAKEKGIAFGSNQAERSISQLKQIYDDLKTNVEIYSQQKIDPKSSYEQQLEYLNTLLLDKNNGQKLADLYRNQLLMRLNQTVYKNILSSVGFQRADNNVGQDAKKSSHDMVNMFIKNVKNNEQLQEIIDHNITTNFEDSSPTQQDEDSAGGPDIEDPGFDDMSTEEIVEYLNKGSFTEDEIKSIIDENKQQASDELEKSRKKIFAFKRKQHWNDVLSKWNNVSDIFFGEPETNEEVEETSEDENNLISFEDENDSITSGTVSSDVEDNIDNIDDVQPEDNQQQQDIIPEYNPNIYDSAIEENENKIDSVPIEDNSESAIIQDDSIEDTNEDDTVDNINNQQSTIDQLVITDANTPRMIIPGWYITNDGRIIPSARMYMANPIETRAGSSLSDKYKRAAARIRYNIHKHITDKNTNTADKLANIALYVSKILKTTDTSIINPISNALLNEDQNAIKLLIMHENPRTWRSYYVNEYFRDAFKKLLNGHTIARPDYIDSVIFKRFCIKALQYKHVMESKYGWKFITNAAPSIINIDGDDVVGDPDFIAVDKSGNIHVLNIHTMKNGDYIRNGNKPIQMENTKSLFSIAQERSAYADIQIKALQTKPGIEVSSTVLLPVVVDQYDKIYRLYIGKIIPVIPSKEAVIKYKNQEDKLEELTALAEFANKKAEEWASYINNIIRIIKDFRKQHRTSGYRFNKIFEFNPESAPTSIAEAYAQIDKANEFINSIKNYKEKHIDKEYNQIQKTLQEEQKESKQEDISNTIDRINAMPDESKDGGVYVDIVDGEDILDNKDLIQKGKINMQLVTTPEGSRYISTKLEYNGKSYKIHLRRPSKYGKGYSPKLFPKYSDKLKLIAETLMHNPNVVITVDLKRSYITYGEKDSKSAPIELNSKESIISEKDINNLGIQQTDGKIVDIGFYDEKTGVIQSGQQTVTSVIGSADSGSQNQLFLVIKQRHAEDKQQERSVSIPLIKSKFNSKTAAFIGQCFRIIAETNHTADEQNQNRRTLANQMLHLFIGTRLIYNKNKNEIDGVVYTNGDSVRVNGKEFFILDDQQLKDFIKELQKCSFMPKWETFNARLKNLANGSFSALYDHFSVTDSDFDIKIDNADSGFKITKQNFDNDTLCQWLVRNGFLSSRYFVDTAPRFALHNLNVGGKIEQEVKEEIKEPAANNPIVETKQEQEEVIEMSEEEFEKSGYVIADEDEEDDEENAEYESHINFTNTKDYKELAKVKTGEDALNLISTKYKTLAKIMRTAVKRTGMPKITFVLLNELGPEQQINGVIRTKKGEAIANADGTWVIKLYQGNPRPIKTLAHEMVHVLTLGAINKNTDASKAAKMFYNICKETFSEQETKEYGFKNFKEFVAEFFTSPELISLLKSKKPIAEEKMQQIIKIANQSKQKNMFYSVVAFFSRLWQKYILRKDPSAYTQIYVIMSNLLKDSYLNSSIDTLESNDSINIPDIMENVISDIKKRLSKANNKIFSYTNHVTHNTIQLKHCSSPSQLRDAVSGIMTMWIKNEDISPLGRNIDKLKFSTRDMERRLSEDVDFAQWWHENLENSNIPLVRELAETENPTNESFVSKTNPKGYETYEKDVKSKKTVVVKKKDGTKETKTVIIKETKTFYKTRLKNWDAVTPIIDKFMADMRIETRKKIESRQADEELIDREDGNNVFGELLTENYQISPFDKASREVKWLFSTVPSAKKNSLGMDVFMPFRDVFGKVLYYTQHCKTTEEILCEFARRSISGPNKEMFAYLHDRLLGMIKNRWRNVNDAKELKSNNIKNENGEVFDANVDSMIIKVIRSLRQQQNDFVWATSENKTENDGEKSKHISIRTTLYQKGIISTISNWRDQLATGLSEVLKYDPKTQTYKFTNEGGINIFKQMYFDLFVGNNSFIHAYNSSKRQDAEDVIIKWRYFDSDGVRFSEITADDIKTYLHNALLELGVDVRSEVIEHWIGQIMEENPTVSTEIDALYLLLSDQNSKHRPINFFSSLATADKITSDTIKNAFNTGFIIELANLQNEYNLRTQSQMTVAAHNNKYYIVSESNYINDIADVLNRADQNDSYIQMIQEDSFAQGSVISEAIRNGERVDIQVSTFVGMKTKNAGDQGRDYFEINLGEDIISKFEMLHEGYMLSPTTSDKKTYHVIKGIPLVGITLGKRSNVDCYGADLKLNEISIKDVRLLDRFISYFESERAAVEKAIIANETGFYKNHPDKKIVNYSDKNGMYFSSLTSIPTAGGNPIFLNLVGNSPRQNLAIADKYFFNRPKNEQRMIVSMILRQCALDDINKAEEVGLIKRGKDGLYENIGIDGATIFEMATNIGEDLFGKPNIPFKLKKYKNANGSLTYGPNYRACIDAAIKQYILDCSIKHLMSMQEYQRLFSGSKSFYKWQNNGTHVTDISIDYTKRRGGDISTGGVNITDIDPLNGMEELGTYNCIEIKDYNIESVTLAEKVLIEQFETSEFASIASVILSEKNSSTLDLTNTKLPKNLYEDKQQAEQIVLERYGEDFVNIIKQKAKADAMQYFKDREKKDANSPVNVADGATYISDRMCEKLLREEGKWDDKMKYAFEVLRGEHGLDVMSKEGQKLYKSILDVVIGTQKYTATGFRKSNDGQGGILMTPYYNKTALFPVFDQIAYGNMSKIIKAMKLNNVDMMMMTSAVKVGSQGSITIDDFLNGNDHKNHTYVQEMRFLRKQLNTDPTENEESNLGTQTIKIALSNLRMNDNYTNPFTGKTTTGKNIYKTIMQCYNILTDIGFEQVMLRFCKKGTDGSIRYVNNLFINSTKDDITHVSMPEIDEKALSDFLLQELNSRDCNDNMLDVVSYDSENDRLNAPLSAISGSSWVDSILASFINKTIIDTKSPGAPYIQRSVFSMEGEGIKTLNNGEELRLINDDGSMDAIISVDFFKDVVPNYNNLTFEQVRQYLIDHKLIGKDAKTYTISYRIPTQAQSSINALKFVDIIPVVRDTIILPKEFTKLTGSDFDIDKLFLSRLFINQYTISDPNKMFSFLDSHEETNNKLETLRKAYTNRLFQQYITLLMDKNSHNTKWRPIDADTELWKEVYDDLYSTSSNPVESMRQDTIAYQTNQKNNFVTGKIGIGPYALNNNNHIYTMLYGISLNPKGMLHNVGDEHLDMGTLCRNRDIYGNSILSWLSGGINAHVDIAKDPFITKLNINAYTYNISNFLLRAGFGRNALWFLNLPAIKELSKRMNSVTGQYLRQSNKNEFDIKKEIFDKYKEELLSYISDDTKNTKISINDKIDSLFKFILNRDLTINDIIFDRRSVRNAILDIDKDDLINLLKSYTSNEIDTSIDLKKQTVLFFNQLCENFIEKAFLNDMVQKDKNKSILYRMVKQDKITDLVKTDGSFIADPALYNYLAVIMFDKINKKEAKTTSDLTRFSKIDTKKQGSTVAAQIDFLQQYDKFISKQYGEHPDITGDVEGFFGLLNDKDVLGFDTSLTLQSQQISNALPYTEGSVAEFDILDSGYVSNYIYNPVGSFIDNKTRKAINALTAIVRNDSIEGTYGFQMMWKKIKSDFAKASLSENAQSKLRSVLLGSIKSFWIQNAMKQAGIDPISLFKDTKNSLSLSHELVKLKTKRIRYIDENGKKRISSVGEKFKDNALLNILYDARTKDEYLESDKLIEILDFIMVHIPFTDDTRDANIYIDAWKQLYNDDVTHDFAVKLMFYSFLVSNDTGANNLFKYVPFEMLQEYGLFDAERELIKTLGDPAFMLSAIKWDNLQEAWNFIIQITNRAESILVEDFDFSTPFSLETKRKHQDQFTGQTTNITVQEYTGFATQFGIKSVNKDGSIENSNRIPYVFVPIKIYKNSWVSKSNTIRDDYGNIINRSYIRVLNPIANYENQQKYLIYKRIGQIEIPKIGIVPIYMLVNSSMYNLSNYKIYNYDNIMNIYSSQAVSNMSKYIYSTSLSIDKLNEEILNAINSIIDNQKQLDENASARSILDPLFQIDAYIAKMHALQQAEFRVYRIKNVILAKYNNYEYMREYINRNKVGKENMLKDLYFVLTSNSFDQEEKTYASDMIVTIKEWIAKQESSKPQNKQPNIQSDPKAYHMHSGGANGADIEWANIAIKYGIPNDVQHISHYYSGFMTTGGNIEITQEEFKEGMNRVIIADQSLHRLDKLSEDKAANVYRLLARNWKQVKSSDAVFAIGQFKQGNVDGGTGWAVQMAIDSQKPVHVFDLDTQKWYIYDYDTETFTVENTPKLTKNFAGIGIRSIDQNIEQKTIKQKHPVKYIGDAKREAALKAIDDVFKNTFGELKEDNVIVNQQESVKPKNDPERFNTAEEDKLTIESNKTILSNNEDGTLKDNIYTKTSYASSYENTGSINVSSYETTNNLSNFSYRPFKSTLSKLYGEFQLNSVEHAFQLSKAIFAYQHGDISNDMLMQIYDTMLNIKNGKDIKQIGRRIPMSEQTLEEWNKVSEQVLYIQMKRSFEQNSSALEELLRTGDSKITHNYPNGSPIEPNSPQRFGKLLEKVRRDLKDQQQTEEICK